MNSFNFYHLEHLPMAKALPRLLQKIYEAEHRVLVLCPDSDSMEELNHQLWSYSTKTFIPHGNDNDPNPARQPIFFSTQASNPNQANILVLIDQVVAPDAAFLARFDKLLYLFDGSDEHSLQLARTRWKEYKSEAKEMAYYQQDASGKWQEKHRQSHAS